MIIYEEGFPEEAGNIISAEMADDMLQEVDQFPRREERDSPNGW